MSRLPANQCSLRSGAGLFLFRADGGGGRVPATLAFHGHARGHTTPRSYPEARILAKITTPFLRHGDGG